MYFKIKSAEKLSFKVKVCELTSCWTSKARDLKFKLLWFLSSSEKSIPSETTIWPLSAIGSPPPEHQHYHQCQSITPCDYLTETQRLSPSGLRLYQETTMSPTQQTRSRDETTVRRHSRDDRRRVILTTAWISTPVS